MFADTLILPDKINFSNQILGSSLSLPAYGRVGQGQHSLAAHFAKRNTKNCGDERARARQQSPKIRILKIGGTFWIKSELFLTKIPILTFRPAPAFPPAETRRAKQNNFLSIFCIFRAPFFLLKGIENCFALMFGLMPNGGNASHPQPAFGGQSRRAKIPSPQPPSFLHACLSFALKFFERADGGTSI